MATPYEPKPISGKLEIFFEQGMEHNAWSFCEDGKQGYDALHMLEKGDMLVVFNDAARSQKIFQGVIDFEKKAAWLDDVGSIFDMQKNVDPKQWAKMFREEKPALLIPRAGKMRP